MFIKYYVKVMEECKDLVEWNIICLILSKYTNNNKPKIQQTYIAKRLYISKGTVRTKLKSIIGKGLIKTKPTYITVNGIRESTTEFEILPKLRNLIENNTQSVTNNSETESKKIKPTENKNNVDGMNQAYELQNLLYAALPTN